MFNLRALAATALLCSTTAALADSGKSPGQLYVAGVRDPQGAFSVYDPARCSWSAAQRLLGSPLLGYDTLIPIQMGDGTQWNANRHSQQMFGIINAAFTSLHAAGDRVVQGHSVCTGMISYQNGPNMFSHVHGYVMLDPRFVSLVWGVSGGGGSMEFFTLHEFAHQLQYWNNEFYETDTTSRRRELVADCIGGALEVMNRNYYRAGFDQVAARMMVNGVAKLANYDFHAKDFHGSPANRAQAVSHGIRFVQDQLSYWGTTMGLSSTELMKRCDQFVRNTDAAFGANWPDQVP